MQRYWNIDCLVNNLYCFPGIYGPLRSVSVPHAKSSRRRSLEKKRWNFIFLISDEKSCESSCM